MILKRSCCQRNNSGSQTSNSSCSNQEKRTHCGTKLALPKANSRVVNSRFKKEDLKPLVNPSGSLSLCLKHLESEDWKILMDGFKSVRAMAKHHPEVLQTKLHEVCLLLAQEVSNECSTVACAAMDTLAELHVHLGEAMDPEAEQTGRALLLKLAQTTSTFIHQQANVALDALVKTCSPGRVVNPLLSTGLSHGSAAVRGSTAQHLHQLMDITGEKWIMTAGKTFTERFIHAVSKMSVDAAPEVRQYGQKMLKRLARHKAFEVMWEKVVSERQASLGKDSEDEGVEEKLKTHQKTTKAIF